MYMCGIVGYLGFQEVKSVLLKGLKTLEYRGYDSAGISIFDKGKIRRVRAAGKLAALEERLRSEIFEGNMGIGHTRWATHGKATEQNAHPHSSQKISLVHNGIIENYMEIREQLLQEGVCLQSETDSELVAHLISKEVSLGNSLFDAVKTVKEKIRGAYAILVLSEDEPGKMIGFKEGPPLIIGRDLKKEDEEIFFASDVLAMVDSVSEVLYLEDGEIAVVKRKSIELFDDKGSKLDQNWVELNWSSDVAEKSGYEHYMLKEIFEQPNSFKQMLQPHIDLDRHRLNLSSESTLSPDFLQKLERIFIVACGTSYYAGLYGKYIIEKFAGVPVELDVASEFRYREPSLPKNSLVVVISQSGETADTLAALRLAKAKNISTLSICNSPRSTIDREADCRLYMNSGVEIGVASTKAFTSSMGLLALFALSVAKSRGLLSEKEEAQNLKDLLEVPSKMEAVLSYDAFFESVAEAFKKFRGYLYMGRGAHYAIALEGALKMKELAYKHAEGYAAGEMKHGPLALIDEEMLVLMICPKDSLYEKTLSNLEEAKARGGYIVAIGTLEDKKLESLCEDYLALPEGSEITNPLLETLPLQLLAYHVSKALGHDVDQPRNLAKSVTVE